MVYPDTRRRRTITSANEAETGHTAQPAIVARVNVALIKESAQALADLQRRTHLKKVDIVNRAIQLYDFIATELGADRQIYVRDKDGSEVQVKIFM